MKKFTYIKIFIAEEMVSSDEKKEQEEGIRYREGILKTAIASIFGIAGGFLSYLATGNTRSRDVFAILILLFLIYIQKPVLKRFDVNVNELSGKDWLYIGFITFDLWYVSWVFLLNP